MNIVEYIGPEGVRTTPAKTTTHGTLRKAYADQLASLPFKKGVREALIDG